MKVILLILRCLIALVLFGPHVAVGFGVFLWKLLGIDLETALPIGAFLVIALVVGLAIRVYLAEK
jgi:hypothetical protein